MLSKDEKLRNGDWKASFRDCARRAAVVAFCELCRSRVEAEEPTFSPERNGDNIVCWSKSGVDADSVGVPKNPDVAGLLREGDRRVGVEAFPNKELIMGKF